MNCNKPLISVIIPVYNVEDYIEKCIQSIISQSYTNLEIILIDDGSTDGSGFLCDKYMQEDKRVIVVHQKNRGLSGARNAGIDIANGEYLMFVDSDDYVSEDIVLKLYDAISSTDAQMSICNFWYDFEKGCYENTDLPIVDEVISGSIVLKEKMFSKKSWYWVIAVCKLYKKELFDSVRFSEGKLHEDEFILHEIMLQCNKIACVSKPMYFYVQRANGIMHSCSCNVKKLDSTEAVFNRAYDLCGIKGYEDTAAKYLFVALKNYYRYYDNCFCNDEKHRLRNLELQKQFRYTYKAIRNHKSKISAKLKIIFTVNSINMFMCAKAVRKIKLLRTSGKRNIKYDKENNR